MAWYPGATRMELQPESDTQPAIRPTQFIIHSIAAPWTARRMYEYWRDSTSLDSHFGLGYAGDLGQFIGTETRADANYQANRRPDGTGAVSIETASNLQHTDPWSEAQVEQLIRLGVWLHERHGIPLRICRSASDPGYGYHRLHAAWSTGGTACPGDARVRQFRELVFPEIVRRATGQPAEEPAPAPTPAPSEEDFMDFTSLATTKPMTIQAGSWREIYWDVENQDGADDHGAGESSFLSGNHYTGTVSLKFAEDAPVGVSVRMVQEYTGGTSGEPTDDVPVGKRNHAVSVTGRVPVGRTLMCVVTNDSPEPVTVAWAGLRLLTWPL
ncbi:N-acetylmuramoyl-L-alanine amidase [Streptomyces lavendulocolor]|uniref:peptidoglycan recognition protein family protein n=1 Tax=Streptomyces lavendulocolor TaxID=67316 RepID=UPI0033D6ABE0